MSSVYKRVFHVRRIVVLLIGVVMTVSMLLPITAHAKDSEKVVRVGWYESPFNMVDGDIDLLSDVSYLTRITVVVSQTAAYATLKYYSNEEAKTTLIDLIHDNPIVVICAIIILIALILIIILQRRIIVTQKKANESPRMVEYMNKKVYIDPLTHVKNKAAFDVYMNQTQKQINRNEVTDVAIGVFDCDYLKLINDQYGHNKGDNYLEKACSLICHVFHHSPVFRIEGDEFIVVLMNEDYINRKELISRFNEAQERTISSSDYRWEHVSVSVGIADYNAKTDKTLTDTFHRADKLMYENKRARKENSARKESNQ